MKSVYTIPPDAAFLDSLAAGLWQKSEKDIFKLSRSLILLPTRRSCRALHEAFLRQTGLQAALLPRMQPFGDIDEDELIFTAQHALDVLPAISPVRRQLLLTQLIRARDKDLPIDQASQLALALARFLDQVQIERCSWDRLKTLVEKEDLAVHWQQTLQFLEILTSAWPPLLQDEAAMDPALRRNAVLEAQAEAWRAKPPDFPIIAAGSTGTMPATADLLNVIAALPKGAVILPGLDLDLDEEAWQALEPSHPQYNMQQLIKKFDVVRDQVQLWSNTASLRSSRVRLLQTSMRPAEVSEEWRHLKPGDIGKEGLTGLSKIEADHPQEEAQTIALLMRHALETPNKTTALVTPDRALAQRVCTMLARWGIEANDSAGASLASQPIGNFLQAVLAAASPHAGSVAMLSLLKHPFAACGLNPAECRNQARQVELHVWRSDRPETSPWLEKVHETLQPLTAQWNVSLPLTVWLKAHIEHAETLAASDTQSGAERLWQDDSGEAAAQALDDLRQASTGFPPLTGEEYTGLMGNFLRGVTIRPMRGQHPRLSILGVLEARLLQPDLVILGGLNEGTWPPEPPIDPWMSRPMKNDFGLPSPERLVGLSAHDFVQLSSAPEVVLTRAKRAGNAPTVPSRFLLQLETVLQALGYSTKQANALNAKLPWLEWARHLDMPDQAEIKRLPPPEPRPPQDARPTALSVTEIGTWRRNPYAIYARHILKLKKLEPLEADIDAADRGSIIHAALDRFVKKYPDTLPPNAQDELLATGRELFAAYDEYPEVKAFWWPRFERIAGWFIVHETRRRAAGTKLLQAEADGKTHLNGFTLKGRADRVDCQPEGGLALVDYKTGSVPQPKDIKSGYEPQLALLGLIAQQGGFRGIDAGQVAELAYWKLNGGRDIAEEKTVSGDLNVLITQAADGLQDLIRSFADPNTPYQAVPKPLHQPRFDDYAHLARLAEWGRTGESE